MSPAKLTPKSVSESQLETTHLVLPEHTNYLGNVFGGTIMSWVDIAAAIVAFRHCRTVVVTASIDELNFLHPVKLGHVVDLKASVNYASKRSIEVGVKVWGENPVTGAKRHTATAYLTFVSLDDDGNAQELPPVVPETDEQKRRFHDGEKRYNYRKSNRNK